MQTVGSICLLRLHTVRVDVSPFMCPQTDSHRAGRVRATSQTDDVEPHSFMVHRDVVATIRHSQCTFSPSNRPTKMCISGAVPWSGHIKQGRGKKRHNPDLSSNILKITAWLLLTCPEQTIVFAVSREVTPLPVRPFFVPRHLEWVSVIQALKAAPVIW